MTPFADDPLDQQARDEDGAEERGDDTDDQRRGEALNRTVAEDEQHDTRDDRRQVTVDDGRIGLRETVLDGQRKTLAAAKLLLDTFVDDHVRIDGHTHRQHDTRDTRKGQHGAERHQNAHQQEDVREQRDVGHPARRLVEQTHVEQHEDEGDHERDHTGVDRLLAQRRTYDRILDDLGRSGNLTRIEHVGQVLGLLDGEIAGDLRLSLVDLRVDAGSRIDVAVENDGDALADIFARHARPLLRTFGVHGHRNLGRGAALGVLLGGFRNDRTIERSLAVGRRNLDGVEVETTVDLVVALDAPLEHDVGGEQLADGRLGEVLVDGCHVGLVSGSDGGAACEAGIEDCKERVLRVVEVAFLNGDLGRGGRIGGADFGDQALGLGGGSPGGSGSLGGSGLGRSGGSLRQFGLDELVGSGKRGENLIGVVGGPELQRSGSLQQVADALRLLHARKLDQNAVRVREAQDVGLRNAEVVDTAAQHVERCADGSLGLLLEDLLDVGVRAFERDVLAVGAYEKLGDGTAVRKARIRLHEVGDIVGRRALLHRLVGHADRLDESRIVLAVAGQSLHDILDLHLQHDVHTALEVQAQVQLLLLTLLVGELAEAQVVNRQVLHRIEVMLFGLALLVEGELRGISGRLLLYATRLERKRELINTRESQQDRNEFNKTFTLHLSEK